MISEGEDAVLPFEHLYAPVAEYIKKSPRARRQINFLIKNQVSRIRKARFPGGLVTFNYTTNQNRAEANGDIIPPTILPGVDFGNGIEISRNVVIVRGGHAILSNTVISALIGGPLSRAIDLGADFTHSDALIVAVRNMSRSIRITIDVPPASLCWKDLQR